MKTICKLICALLAVCIIAAFACFVPAYAEGDTPDLIEIFEAGNWTCLKYTKGWSTVTAGDYRFQMDCKIYSGKPVIRVGNDEIGDIITGYQSNYEAEYDDENYKYTVTFTMDSNWSGNLGVLIGNYDGYYGGVNSHFICANPTLYKLNRIGEPSGASLINTFASDYYSTSRTADKWNRRNFSSGKGICTSSIPANFFERFLPYKDRITLLKHTLMGRTARTYHSYEDVNRDGRFDISDLIHTKSLQVKALNNSNTQSPEDYMYSMTNSSGYDASAKFTGGAATKAQALKNKIFSQKNTEDIYDITGKKYYISKNTSLSSVPAVLNAGDAVLFERGGVWRVNGYTLEVPQGVIFGAYGEGEKPAFYGSAKDYAKAATWTDTGDNIWRVSLKGGNAGIIVFDEIYALGVKKWTKEELTSDYDFYSDDDAKMLYLYCSSDPKTLFSSIEIGQRNDILQVKSGAVLDNVCVRYTGAHGITMSSKTENVKVTNCEIGLLGGSRQFGETRYGNGIEMQLGVKNIEIKDNYVYQCYDAGITFQSWNSADMDTFYDGIDINENLVENCFYNIEFFSTQPDRGGHYTELHNISMRNNILRFAGYCWSYEQRPGHWMTANIRSSQRGWYEETENFVIADNIFDCSRACLVYWWWHSTDDSYVYDAPHPGVSVAGNSFYETNTIDGRVMGYRYEKAKEAYDLDTLKDAVAVFDPAPEEVVWLDTI
ncbi:MAG: hypothetical protein IKZ59_06820 [Clostridia bacterium]|nr:hypothetical protein [Clostridia bacterium]